METSWKKEIRGYGFLGCTCDSLSLSLFSSLSSLSLLPCMMLFYEQGLKAIGLLAIGTNH